MPFRFETGGSQILFYSREEDFSAAAEARQSQTIRAFREFEPATAPPSWPIPYPSDEPAGRPATQVIR